MKISCLKADASNPMEMEGDEQETGSKEAKNIGLSDMDYLKRKITSDDKSNNRDASAEPKDKKKKKSKSKDADVDKCRNKTTTDGLSTDKEMITLNKNDSKGAQSSSEDFERKSDFTIKLRGLPFHAKKKDIEEFLSPLKIVDIRLPKDNKNRPSGRAYVDLGSKECVKEALKRHKDYIKGRYIEVFEDKRRVEVRKDEAENEPPWMENAKELAENKDLSIAEVCFALCKGIRNPAKFMIWNPESRACNLESTR